MIRTIGLLYGFFTLCVERSAYIRRGTHGTAVKRTCHSKMMLSRGNGLVKRAWNFRHATVNGVPSIGVINNTLASKQGASNMYGGTQFHPIQGVRGIITKTAFINVTGQFACALTDECQVIAIRVDDGKVVYKPEGITADTLDAAKDAVNEALYPRSPVSFEPRHYMQDHYTSGGGGMHNHAMAMGQMSPRYDPARLRSRPQRCNRSGVQPIP